MAKKRKDEFDNLALDDVRIEINELDLLIVNPIPIIMYSGGSFVGHTYDLRQDGYVLIGTLVISEHLDTLNYKPIANIRLEAQRYSDDGQKLPLRRVIENIVLIDKQSDTSQYLSNQLNG